jgi:hypothetical protein
VGRHRCDRPQGRACIARRTRAWRSRARLRGAAGAAGA